MVPTVRSSRIIAPMPMVSVRIFIINANRNPGARMAHWLNNTPGAEHTQQTHQSHNFFHKQNLLKKFHF